MSLFNKLTHVETPCIILHGFGALLREYARGRILRAGIDALYQTAGDTQLDALLALIDVEGTVNAKILKAIEISDVLEISQARDSKSVYPDGASIRARLGV